MKDGWRKSGQGRAREKGSDSERERGREREDREPTVRWMRGGEMV